MVKWVNDAGTEPQWVNPEATPVKVVNPEDEPEKEVATETPTPPPDKTGGVAGFGVDDILKAPFTPPKPHIGETGPSVAEKIDKAGYEASATIGPRHPRKENRALVGLGLFVMLLGLLGFVFLSFVAALVILAVGCIVTIVGSLVKF